MDKKIIYEYLDAKALVEQTRKDLNKRRNIVQDKVKGSNPDFPYQEQSFTITGFPEDYEETILKKRIEIAEKTRLKAEEAINSAPLRIQRIIHYKVMEGLKWSEVAEKMGEKVTENSVKKEFQRWMKEK